METVVFYLLGAMVLTFAALTVTARHIFRAAIYLLFTLIGVAGIYVLMNMNFMAALQIVIYVGGIVVLIIFSIFLTHQVGERVAVQPLQRTIRSAAAAGVGLLLVLGVLLGTHFVASSEAAVDPTVQEIGRRLLNYNEYGYVYPFEVISILLLAALIGSIVIAMKDKQGN